MGETSQPPSAPLTESTSSEAAIEEQTNIKGSQTSPEGQSETMGGGDKLTTMIIPIAILAALAVLPGVLGGYNHTVPMGSSKTCDDAKTNTSLDWDPSDSTPYTCDSKKGLPIKWDGKNATKCPVPLDKLKKATNQSLTLDGYSHICMNKEIEYKTPYPASGPHRPAWPRYGIYKYAPPQRWLHSLEHGGIVALYHPCAPNKAVKKFINTVVCMVEELNSNSKDKLPMFVITPEARIPPCQPFVLLAWMNRLLMTNVATKRMEKFMEERYRHGPEDNFSNGQYSVGLKKDSSKVKCKK